ncbi:FAD-binding oxidoreductase [Nocardioides sp. S-58]|uniref:Delta(24)-sterol reductase n=1 Tax=Nocardioides renjunii TaxID=3095075 RepID=A0ABU5KC60_9ACTN|nr:MULTISPECIES: FAD-binding oxidoreductase [unclassified Nocardioides]MDZ5662422.1 FAD-binding oxidoreductase [Nocardioides sp. S-58]WQQ23781.1 FAD-binding oxidoreductase [Nocardioides sp. S-34]
MREPGGWEQHSVGVTRLRESYAALPAGSPVRLAKRTSNLFRGRPDAGRGLDVSGLTGVIEVDGDVAEVQGMCTYEHLVEVTLAHGRIPLVVPQLRTITLGGAVTGLGIESTSFRSGLPHESVLEMDVLTGAGEVVTTKPGDALFDAFPNSYGSLGYATRLRIELEQVPAHVALRHVRFDDAGSLADAVGRIVADGAWEGERVDGLDGVAFTPDELYLTLARWTDEPGPTSDYTGQQVYYRSLQHRATDRLTIHDYLWRWDTDWFWCSRAFGAQHPLVRRLWPRRLRRSDVYWRLVALDRRLGIGDRLDRRAGRPQGERVVQDVEVPVDRLAEFLAWFDREVGMRPVWLCPLRLRRASGGEDAGEGEARPWPGYPLAPATTYVNVGFWGVVNVGPDAPLAPRNRAIEAEVSALGGHKSLYSEAFYDRGEFDRLYGGDQLARVKRLHDPDDRLTPLYDKVVGRR